MINTIARCAKFMTNFSKIDNQMLKSQPLKLKKMALKDILVKVLRVLINFVPYIGCWNLFNKVDTLAVKPMKFRNLEVEKWMLYKEKKNLCNKILERSLLTGSTSQISWTYWEEVSQP